MTIHQAKEKYFQYMRKFARPNNVWNCKVGISNVNLSEVEKKYRVNMHPSIYDYFNSFQHDIIFGECVTKSGASICIILQSTLCDNEENFNDVSFTNCVNDWFRFYKGTEYTPLGSDGGQLYYCAEVLVNNTTGKVSINWGGDSEDDFDIEELMADDLADLISKLADSLEFNEFLRNG